MKELAAAFGIHRVTVSAHLRENGVRIRMQGLDAQDVPEAARLYEEEAWSAWMLSEKFGVSPKTILTALRKAGVRIRPARAGPGSARTPE